MSVVRRYDPEEVAAWARRDREGKEPFDIPEIPGWTRRVYVAAELLPNERMIRFERGDQSINAMRWWDSPLHPGNPMQIASTREVTVGSRRHEIVTTSAFEGVVRVVDVVFERGNGWAARIVFERCTPDDVLDVLGRIAWATRR
jgi:hypothetical protein